MKSSKTMKLLVAGVPATGKTTVGDYLKNNHNFIHFDVESEDADPRTSHLRKLFWEANINQFLDELGTDKGVVITWGFVCDDPNSLHIIKKLQEHGFRFIWFFAEEPLARIAFLKRMEESGWGDINAFDIQMRRIEKLDLNTFNKPIIIKTISDNGRKKESKIVADIVRKTSVKE
jgi:hypothetical protein